MDDKKRYDQHVGNLIDLILNGNGIEGEKVILDIEPDAEMLIQVASEFDSEISIIKAKSKKSLLVIGDEITAGISISDALEFFENEKGPYLNLHTHIDDVPLSIADYILAFSISDKVTFIVVTPNTIYQFKAEENDYKERSNKILSLDLYIHAINEGMITHAELSFIADKYYQLYKKRINDLTEQIDSISSLIDVINAESSAITKEDLSKFYEMINIDNFEIDNNHYLKIIKLLTQYIGGDLINKYATELEREDVEIKSGVKYSGIEGIKIIIVGLVRGIFDFETILGILTEHANRISFSRNDLSKKFNDSEVVLNALKNSLNLNDEFIRKYIILFKNELHSNFFEKLEDEGFVNEILLREFLVDANKFENELTAVRILSKDELDKLLKSFH